MLRDDQSRQSTVGWQAARRRCIYLLGMRIGTERRGLLLGSLASGFLAMGVASGFQEALCPQ